MKTIMRKALAVAVIAGVSGGAMAVVENGTLGSSSTGRFDVTMKVGGLTRVFGLKDFIFNAPDKPGAQAICIYANTTNFSIDATTTNDFALENSGTQGAKFTLELFPNADGSGDASATWSADATAAQQVTSIDLATGDSEVGDSPTCTTGNFSLKVNATLDNNVKAGNYTDRVTLTVSPI